MTDIYDIADFDALLEELQDESFGSSSDTTSTDGSDSVSLVPAKPKRKRVRNRKRLPTVCGPVVVKHDIRRSYLNMITNVLNSADFALLYGFMDTFLAPDALSTFKKTVGGVTTEDCMLSLKGIYQAAQHWCKSLTIAPDAIFNTIETCVEYHTGKIIGKMKFVGTKMYEEESLHEAMKETEWTSDVTVSKRQYTAASNGPIIQKIMKNVEDMVNKLIPRKDLASFEVTGTFILSTDSEKRITAMEMLAEC